MRRFKSLMFGTIGALIYLLPGIALIPVALYFKANGNDMLIIACIAHSLTVWGAILYIAVIMSPTSKFWRGLLLVYGILTTVFGFIFGICLLMSYKYCRDLLREGEIPYVSLRERIRHMRERRREFKERMLTDPDFADYINYLKKRKRFAVLKAFGMWVLALLISLPSLFITVMLSTTEVVWLIWFIVYIVLCIVILLINHVQIGFSSTVSDTTTTTEWTWRESSFLIFDTSDWVKTGEKTETRDRTFYFLSWKSILMLLLGWLFFIPATIALLIAIFTKYDSDYKICGVRPEKIPRGYIRVPMPFASATSFLLGFVNINCGLLEFMYEHKS